MLNVLFGLLNIIIIFFQLSFTLNFSPKGSHGKNFTSYKDLGTFSDGISGAAITMKYNQMNAELMRNKKLSDKITNLKKQLFNI